MTTHVCRQCNADIQPHKLGRVEGEDGEIRITIDGLPMVECTNGHKRFPSADFPLKFIETMLKSDDLVVAEPAVEKGLFRKHAHCPGCGQQLPEQSGGASAQRVRVDMPQLDPVGVELAVPLFACPGCRKEATLPKNGVQRGVMQAVANAFRSADIPPG
ncbi:MAG TPA: hypothetical protein PLI48_05915 [Gammaproteobacteria bacterium]|nr:hypothetical protein [Gammaproteobacteria bacterium]HRP88179.1 hypothetical protein [Gammaproteobacteria bacterium]